MTGYWTLALLTFPFASFLRVPGADFPQGELGARDQRVAKAQLAGMPDHELAHSMRALPGILIAIWHGKDDDGLKGCGACVDDFALEREEQRAQRYVAAWRAADEDFAIGQGRRALG